MGEAAGGNRFREGDVAAGLKIMQESENKRKRCPGSFYPMFVVCKGHKSQSGTYEALLGEMDTTLTGSTVTK